MSEREMQLEVCYGPSPHADATAALSSDSDAELLSQASECAVEGSPHHRRSHKMLRQGVAVASLAAASFGLFRATGVGFRQWTSSAGSTASAGKASKSASSGADGPDLIDDWGIGAQTGYGTASDFGYGSTQCADSDPRPAMPETAISLNGIAWPPACFKGANPHHFFVVGDWGGFWGIEGRVQPWPNDGRRKNRAVDSIPQQLVSQRMREVAQTSRPEFLINVGDSFYPGGIDDHCDVRSREKAFGSMQFKYIFEGMYDGDGLNGKEWWGVMGNHDYGGFRYNKAWDQIIYYTWHAPDSRWLMPALFWSRRVNYGDFSADFFFIDTNKNDAGPPNLEEEHNICSEQHNMGDLSCGLRGLTDPQECHIWFTRLFEQQKPWLEERLATSSADWQIIVTHYPPTFEPSATEMLKPMSAKYGVDLIITGHTHRQEVHYKEPPYFNTAWIISGGGGGIGSESVPDTYGNDDEYGFMDLTISKDRIIIEAHSHGGVRGETIIRSRTEVFPI